MKKLYLVISLLTIFGLNNFYKGQSELWGLNAAGGDGYGVLYGMQTGATTTTSLYNFTGSPGYNPQYTKLVEASNGKLYGMTNLGGSNNLGVIFEYDTATNVYTRKVDFTGTNGANPKGALIQAANGKLYGMTQLGGTSNSGVIFEYNISSGIYSVVVNFSGTSGSFMGSQPIGALVQPNPAITKLYGMTRSGGVNDKGVIFEYDYSTPSSYTNTVDFNGNTGSAIGANPFGQLVKAVSASSSTTTLYGLTSAGGANNAGVLFEYDYSNPASGFTKKVDLLTTTGSNPQGSLLLASNGRLYGATVSGGANSGGVIFEYIISSNTYNKLTDLTNGAGSIGGSCSGELMQATNGKLYGLTRFGGATNAGVAFEYDISIPATPVYSKIDLSTANGSLPFGSLIQVSTGKLYGLTSAGGSAGSVVGSVLFQYNISTHAYVKKIDLNLSMGGNPTGCLVQSSSNGKLYGLASIGGTNNSVGVIFEYDRTSGIYTKKIDFSGNTGSNPGSTPFGSMMQASDGKLYGLTSAGGSLNLGTLFRYDVTTNTQTKLVDFTGNTGANQGSVPYGSLVQSSVNGKLYGMTKQGGTAGQGVIFEFDPVANTYSKKTDLTLASVNGYSAFGSMVESSSKLYGMTQLGGSSSLGVIFEFDPATAVYTKKIDFTGTTGANQGSLPFGSLIQTATVGVLYGMTKTGGVNDQGVIFEYNALTNTYTKKYDMIAADGAQPLGSLIRAANGKLYGVTNTGGANSSGVLFEYDIATATYTKKMDFTSATGNFPAYTQLLEVCTKPLTPGAISSSTNALCQSAPTILNYSISAVSNATAYAWSLPAGAAITSGSTIANINADFSGVAAGSYTYGVAGVNICGPGALSINNFTVNAMPAISVNSGAICAGSSFTISPTGASTYSVQGNIFVVSPPTGNSTYTVVGVSSAGCISSNTATSSVTVNALPTIGVNSGTICAGDPFTISPTGVVNSTVSGGSLIVSPATSTFYTIIGQDANGCVSANTATSNVTVNALPTIGINSSTMCAGQSATLTPFGAGVGATYYVGAFSGSGPFVVSPGSSASFTAAATTSFGCVSSNTPAASVTVYSLPVISVNNPTMCIGQNAVINPSGAGVSGSYTVGLVNGAGPFTVNPAISTNYNVSGTSSLGCISSNTPVAAVTVFTLPVVTVNSGTLCVGGTYTFVPNGALTYTITGPTSGTSFPVSPPLSTSYTIAGTNTAGCISVLPATANVTVYALPTLSVNSGSMCAGTAFTIFPSGGVNYTVQPINVTTTNSLVVNPSLTSTYFVTGINSSGCLSSSAVNSTVNVIALPVVTATSGALCIGDVLTSSINGAATYTYISSASTLTSNGSVTLSPGSTTSYSIYGTNPAGCISTVPAIITLTVNSLPIIIVGSPTNEICIGASATITANGANTYNWGTSTNSFIVVSPTTSTSYSVIGTDLNGCSNQTAFPLTIDPLPTITVISGAICPGNSFTLTPGGASTYTFSSGSSIVSPTITTSYSVTGTSTSGCVSYTEAVATVSVVNILTVTISGNTSICLGGTVDLTANGASTYSWTNGPATNTFAASPTSNTTYTVLGASGSCSNVATAVITVNSLPNVSAVSSNSLICVNESVNLMASGATTYSWSTSSLNPTVTVSPTVTTTYVVIGTDANGCVNNASIIVSVSTCLGINNYTGNAWQYALYPNPNAGEFSIETSAPLTITVLNALGQAVLKQQLSEGKNQIDLNDNAKGIYFVLLKNGNSTKTIKIVKQ